MFKLLLNEGQLYGPVCGDVGRHSGTEANDNASGVKC